MLQTWIRLGAVALASFALTAFATARQEPKGVLTPTGLRCEYLVNPLAVDVAKPRLSWELTTSSDKRNLTQTAYEIVVAKTRNLDGKDDRVWTSGVVKSPSTCQIEYEGPRLQAGQSVVWRVRVWDNLGGASEWSAPALWSVGLLNPQDWGSAKWIGDPTSPAAGTTPLPSPMLRKNFSTAHSKEKVDHAVVYVSALGLCDLWINERHVGDQALAPEWTDYTKHVQYQAYDVTNYIESGDNCIGALLGDGWYAGKVGLAGIVPGGPARAIYGRQPRLLVRLDISFADGTHRCIVSDNTWESTLTGPIVSNDLLDGETYDARREMRGWNKPGFDASAWAHAVEFDAPAAAVVAQPNGPIRVNRELHAVAITEPKPGVYIFDLGQNMVGWCRVTFTGKAGATITMRHAEVLNPHGSIYTANLRGAAQTDRYTFAADGPATYEPRFTYHGFRYVEVTGLSSKPPLDSLVGRVANSSAPEVGSFECSDPMVNRLWQNILWTQRGNLMGVPTDCPQRDERCGWMGDILAFAPTACFNMDMAAFLTKWIPDTRDAQAADGRFADFSPHPYGPDKRFSGVPAWGDAGVFVPWVAYRYYGDQRILAEQFDAAVRWVEYIRAKNPDLLWKKSRGNDYGDWLNADTLKLEGWPAKGAEVPKDVFATMFFYRSTQIVAEMAKVLGKTEEATKYGELADNIGRAFETAYISQDGAITGDTQAGYALALHFGLVPEALRAQATARMIDRFRPYDGQISTGFHSTLPLMTQLSLRGHNDDAYRLLLNRKMPSWGYEVDHGATTVWERWDGWVEGRGFQDPGMNSFAHYAIGAVGEWMYGTMLGIQPDSPGFASVVIHPHPGPDVEWANASYHSIRGPIACAWKQREKQLRLSVTIPPNVMAMVVLPTRDAAKATVDGKPLANSQDVTIEKSADSEVQCRVGSGSYEFVVQP